MPTVLFACCLTCRTVIAVMPPLVVGGVVWCREGALCPSCILNETFTETRIRLTGSRG